MFVDTPGSSTPETMQLRALLAANTTELRALLEKYGASNPLLFGSVARGDATSSSDIDILVEMNPEDGNLLMRASGLLEETRELLGKDIDIFPVQLLKSEVNQQALSEAVPL
ncbi:MAG: nucleotidyltransferase domain-containing protein [Varibaculum cambriense]|uniref:nucleotidyltransferase family protein n=1 Tax=Varibaculum cambriense TaxID=184870 RepID=UPI002904BFA8|nr:nucleotidyltransferase domain-containing protein [Varibaculum cambriense]MDU1051991.1 nucleotidyltransferase domain-containing protein [Varibaculum cambriense]